MIGLGNWACDVNTMFFSGEVKVRIFDDGGAYGFELNVPGVEIPDVTVVDVKEDGNVLTATTQTSLLPGKNVEITAAFDGDAFEGTLKIPFMGKINLKNGRRTAE